MGDAPARVHAKQPGHLAAPGADSNQLLLCKMWLYHKRKWYCQLIQLLRYLLKALAVLLRHSAHPRGPKP